MTRVLIIGASTPQIALEYSYQYAFRQLGAHAELFDPSRALYRFARGRVLRRAASLALRTWTARAVRQYFERTSDWDIVLVFKGYGITPDALADAMARTPRALWLCFNPDSPFAADRGSSSADIRAAIPLFHTYLTWSHTLIRTIQAAGARDVVYLPFAAHPPLHHPAAEIDRGLQGVVSFIGSYDPMRADLLEAIADLPVRIYGNAWNGLSRFSKLRDKVVHRSIFDAELRRVVTSSACSLNILRTQNVGAHNMRSFELPAMGGLMVTSRSRDQAEWFPEGSSCLMYQDKVELRAVVQAVLAGAHDTTALRSAALAHSKPHSYLARARTLLDLAETRNPR